MNSNNFLSTLTHPGTQALPLPPTSQAFMKKVMRAHKSGDHTTCRSRGVGGYRGGGRWAPIGGISEVTIGVPVGEPTEAQ